MSFRTIGQNATGLDGVPYYSMVGSATNSRLTFQTDSDIEKTSFFFDTYSRGIKGGIGLKVVGNYQGNRQGSIPDKGVIIYSPKFTSSDQITLAPFISGVIQNYRGLEEHFFREDTNKLILGGDIGVQLNTKGFFVQINTGFIGIKHIYHGGFALGFKSSLSYNSTLSFIVDYRFINYNKEATVGEYFYISRYNFTEEITHKNKAVLFRDYNFSTRLKVGIFKVGLGCSVLWYHSLKNLEYDWARRHEFSIDSSIGFENKRFLFTVYSRIPFYTKKQYFHSHDRLSIIVGFKLGKIENT